MIFVILGSQKFQFNRLLAIIDNLIEERVIEENVFAQIGSSTYKPKHFRYKRFLKHETFNQYVANSRVVVTHAGTGAIVNSLKEGKKVIAVPRLSQYKEHVDDHQVELATIFADKSYVLQANDKNDLADCFYKINDFNF
ncbi:MAG: beta(1,3)galactosyltransferase EpsH, partial [Tetragenococcus koreensis]|nr:beta(1,3)galactosyltransferase EpsH [Tetragenococcus koreensis]